MALWGVDDADVLRVLELLDAGVSRKAIEQQHLPHVGALALLRIVRNKDAKSVQSVVERHPEWRIKQQQSSADTADNGDCAKTDAQVNAYEAKRLQRMRENREKMLALGLQKLTPTLKRVKRKADPAALEAARANPRRSARISSHAERPSRSDNAPPVASSAEQDGLLEAALLQRRIQRRHASAAVPAYEELDLPVVDLSAAAMQQASSSASLPHASLAAAVAPPVKRQHQSSQLLDIELEHFHDRWLGKQIWPKGKATIMHAMCPRHIPRFSKMSGVQPWRNAIALFVNVQGASLYDNVFQHVARGTNIAVYFQWFAQQRQHVESPVIVRMLRAQRGDAALRLNDATFDHDAAEPSEPVLLFIRHVDGPYIYCGRLGYLGHRPDSSPLEFRWQLLDAAALEWRTIERLIESSSERVDSAAVTESSSS